MRGTHGVSARRGSDRGTGFLEKQVVFLAPPNMRARTRVQTQAGTHTRSRARTHTHTLTRAHTYLVTEDLDLADSTVHQALSACSTVIGVNLQVEGDTLHPLLRGEVCAQTVDTDEHLGTEQGAG